MQTWPLSASRPITWDSGRCGRKGTRVCSGATGTRGGSEWGRMVRAQATAKFLGRKTHSKGSQDMKRDSGAIRGIILGTCRCRGKRKGDFETSPSAKWYCSLETLDCCLPTWIELLMPMMWWAFLRVVQCSTCTSVHGYPKDSNHLGVWNIEETGKKAGTRWRAKDQAYGTWGHPFPFSTKFSHLSKNRRR